jgi:hypothetical protein
MHINNLFLLTRRISFWAQEINSGAKMKKLPKIIGIGILLIAGILASAFFLTSGITKTADSFFETIQAKNYNLAYSFLSKDLQQKSSKDAFKSYLDMNQFSDYQSASWKQRSVKNNKGKLQGTISTKKGDTFPAVIAFIKEEEWKISAIKRTDNKVQAAPAKLPSPKEQVDLIKGRMRLLTISLKKKSMSTFYLGCSGIWKSQTNKKEMNKKYSSLFPHAETLNKINSLEPTLLKQATISPKGILSLNGVYNINPQKFFFELRFVTEKGKWKLVGMDASLK